MIKKEHYLFWAKLFNPVIIIAFAILVWLLIEIANYGHILKLLLAALIGLGLLIWLIWCISHFKSWQKASKASSSRTLYKIWNVLGPVTFIVLCTILGIRLYQSAEEIGTPLNTRVDHIFNERSITLTDENIYHNGLHEIFTNINHKMPLPNKLYVSPDDPLEITFNRNGDITRFEAYLTGQNTNKSGDTYLIDYDASQSNKLTIRRSQDSFNDQIVRKSNDITPLLKITNTKKFADTLKNEIGANFDLYYAGSTKSKVSQAGFIDVHSNKMLPDDDQTFQYNVPVYAHGDTALALVRFFDSRIPANTALPVPDPTADLSPNEAQSFRNKKIGYRLQVANSALGTYYYKLVQTNDGGATWSLLNDNPFLGEGGTALDVKFLNNSLGFVSLSQNSGTSAKLYRTDDAGKTFSEVTYDAKTVSFNNQDNYAPFVVPDMPTQTKDGLQMTVSQGVQGNYENGLAKALYQSTDNGTTWSFVKIIHSKN